MSDATRNDGGVPGAAPAGAADIATRLRKARERFVAAATADPMDDFLANEFAYAKLLFTLARNGALEGLLQAVQIEIELNMAGGYTRHAYKRLLENVRDE